MELKINIPLNDWKEPTEVREEVVQGICDSFLAANTYKTFYPHSQGMYRIKTNYIFRHKNENKFKGFTGTPFESNISVRFNAIELNTAVDLLKKAGYFFHEVYSYGSWKGYICSKYPSISEGRKVDTITLTSDF